MRNQSPFAPPGSDDTFCAHGFESLPPCVPDLSSVVTVPPKPWPAARLGKCLTNVQEMIRQHGGEQVCGWAIDYGPLRLHGWYPPPLYSRWLNHVVWRDPQGNLWEVSPHLALNDTQELLFQATQFLIDPTATLDVSSEDDWGSRPCRYIALRPEGVEVVKRLERAQAAITSDVRTHWIKEALAALTPAGFTPREWKVETIGQRTGTIWLLAD
jgi:hypothetical protein